MTCVCTSVHSAKGGIIPRAFRNATVLVYMHGYLPHIVAKHARGYEAHSTHTQCMQHPLHMLL